MPDEIAAVPAAVSQQPSLADVPSGSVADTAPDAGDDASAAFSRQIDALRASEERQRQAAPPPQASVPQSLPDGREERLALWRQHGMTEQQTNWLRENPRMIDRAD